ncbi:MAG: rRNA adenine N-6-methyltransferase family protein [Candidatus Nanoarchaeia archaeon]
MPRQKTKRNFPDFDATEEEKRFGTPTEVAQYRAKRLKCNTILEIGAGVGFQTVEFAKTCKKVISVEIVPGRVIRAKKNLRGVKNVEFHTANALDKDFIKQLPNIDIIFCDPGRPPTEETRKKASLSPPLEELQKAYKNITEEIAYEVPPHLKDLPKEAEKEFLTYFGQLNRLTLYFNKLKQRDLSVIDVPSNERLEPTKEKPKAREEPMFIGDINQAIIKADLVDALAVKTKSQPYKEDNKTVLLSDHCLESPFVRWYRIISEGTNVKGKDVVLHYPIPEGEYNKEKKQFIFESGKKNVHIFKINNKLIQTEKPS